MPIQSATDLIRIIDPQELDSIRLLFSGNLINLEFFTRTIQTFIAKNYLETEEQMEEVVLSIIDLFEEIDSDADGFITWSDFISYYSEASQEPADPMQELPKSQIIFQQMQQSATVSSGKTAKVLIDSVLPNNAEFTEIPGTTISAIHIFNENYYFITDIGVFVSDSTFLFPKLIFEPTAPVLQGESSEKRVFKLDDRTRERLETQALRKLAAMGVDTQAIDIHGGPQLITKEEEFDRNELLRGINHQPINQLSPIVCSILLTPLPLLMVCMRQPLFVFISLSGTQGASEPLKISSPASSLFWCAQKELLFIGHHSGAISAYKIKLQNKKHSIMAFLEEINKQQQVSGDPIEQINKICRERNITLADLPKEDLIRIYPDLRQVLVDISTEDPEVQVEKDRKRALSKVDVDKLMRLTAKDIEIKHLVTDKIFNPHVSTMESHEIKPSQIILEDPIAYVESIAQPGPLQTAIKEKKHGGVQIDVDAQFLYAKYITNESVRKIAGDFGNWENKITAGNFRLVVAGGDGSITVCDEYLNVVTTFPELHKEGIVSLHVVQDYITSIGYNNVYQISPTAVQQSFLGKCILPEDPDLSTSEIGKLSKESKMKIEINDTKLMKGELIKTQRNIKLIQPPRPGQPIITSFQMGNIIGIVDHEYIVTLFHAISGAHLTRTNLSLPNLHGMKFGQCFYNFNRDMGFIPIGKHMLYIKAIPNEDIGETDVAWNILNDIEKEERKANKQELLDDPHVKVNNKIPIGSISTTIQAVAINHQIHEFAIISGDFEITFYSLLNGLPIRVINVQEISKSISQDVQDGESVPTEYNVIESNDDAQYFTENHVAAEAKNVQQITDEQQRERISHPKDVNSLLTRKKQYVSSIPKQLDPIQMLKGKEKHDLIELLGQKILSIFTDKKSRILFVVGTKGILTFYWKTGCLFDYSGVGVLGRQLLDNNADLSLSEVGNPFNEVVQKAQSQMRVNSNGSGGGFLSYSLNLDLSKILQRDNAHRTNIQGITRQMITSCDSIRQLLFLYDFLNPLEVRAIATSPSVDYLEGAINSRIIMNINITYAQKVLDPCYKLKMRAITYFNQKLGYLGKLRAQQDYQKILRIQPLFQQNQQYPNLESFNLNEKFVSYYKQFLSVYLNENQVQQDAQNSQVTVIETSSELSLLAIGTTDSRVQLFDTSSIKLLRQGVIYLPKISNASAVTTIKFLGTLPLIFISLSNGECFVYTVRPLIPANVLVCSFRHSSYAPIALPSNNNPLENYIRKARSVQRLLLPYTDDSITVQTQINLENEFIKQIFFHYAPEMKNSIYFQNEDSSLEQEGIFGQNQQNIHHSGSQTQTNSQSKSTTNQNTGKRPESSFAIQEDNQILAFRRAFVNMPNSRLSVSTAGNTDDLSDHEDSGSNAQQTGKSVNKSSINKTMRANQPQQNEQFSKMYLITKQIMSKRSAIQGSLQSTVQISLKQNKMRKTLIKVRAACQLVNLTRNFFMEFSGQKQRLFVSKTASEFEKNKRKPLELDFTDMLLNGKNNVKKSDEIMQRVQISDKTKKIIADFQKSRFNVKNTKDEDNYDENFASLSQIEQQDQTIEKKGFLYRTTQQNGKEVNVPVRKMALEGLLINVSPTQAEYNQKDSILLIGDEQGFITQYDFTKLIKELNVIEISMKTKQIQDPQGGPPQEIILGYNEQRLDKRFFTEEYSGKIVPLLHAHQSIVINYSIRCDTEGIYYLSMIKGGFLVIGESRRATIYDLKTAKLLGMCQRVTLDSPPANWEHMFYTEINTKKEVISTQKSNKLTVNELIAASPQAEIVPFQRLEVPPPNSYPWRYLPAIDFQDTISSSAISLGSSHVVQKTTRFVQQSIPVPSLDSDPAKALLKSTGLNPTILSKHKDSWTVRALVSKATDGQMDSTRTQSIDIMNRLSYTKSRLDEDDLE